MPAKKPKKIIEVRPPIVAILGHVDHGKTSILDKIRSSNVQTGEVGGITQKISVFTIDHGEKNETNSGKITFIDTPGHEAFDLMRSRGGNVADIVLLVIAADDGIKPQTEESIEVIKTSKAKPIVVVNKIDLPDTDVDKIKRDLAVKGIQVEGYGGNIPIVEISAKTGLGLDNLLDTINLVVEIDGLSERGELPENVSGSAFVLESVKDKAKGYVASIVVTQGTFDKGDWIAYKSGETVQIEKVKGFVSEGNQNIEVLSAGEGAKIFGLSSIVTLGETIWIVKSNDKKFANALFAVENVESSETPVEEAEASNWLSDMFKDNVEGEEEVQEGGKVNVILKSSSEGSLEAIKRALENINVDNYVVNFISSSVGDITINDVEMASITKAIILGFEVKVDSAILRKAEKKRVIVRCYDIIYKLIEEISDAITVLATPKETEEELGDGEIRAIFTLSDGTMVLGGRVLNGMIKSGAKCYVVRGDDIVGEGRITSLRNQKSEVKDAKKGADFGAIVQPQIEAVEGDKLHCFKVIK